MTEMPPPLPSLRAFLSAARTTLSTPATHRPKTPLTFVIGNESADLDSLCSALLLAYLRTHGRWSPSHPPSTQHIPLSNLPRADLALRPELQAVLRRAGLATEDLLTLSDLPPESGLAGPETRWLLVDHNVLTGELGRRFGRRVVGCVDHHEDEGGEYLRDGDGEVQPRVIRRCGSCASLVVEYAREAWEGMMMAASGSGNREGDAGQVDVQLAHVALAPILVDTTSLTSRDKTTEADVRAVEFAEGVIRRAGVEYDRERYFGEITELKEDLSRLGYRDIFRKDYKQWTDGGLTLGTSSVVQGFGYMLDKIGEREEFLTQLRKWAEEKKLDIAAVMTTLHPGGRFARELLVWAFNAEAVRTVKAFAEENKTELGLEPWQDGKLDDTTAENEWRMCWRQNGLQHSRKQIAPMLREAMKRSTH